MTAETTRLSVQFRHQTRAAVLVFDGTREVWLPKSALPDWDGDPAAEPGPDALVEIEVALWLAIKEGLV